MLPLWEDCKVGEVVSGAFQGPLVVAPQGSACDEARNAPDPLGTGKSASSATARDLDASLLLANPLPIALFPQIPLEACQAFPLPNVGPKFADWEVLSSLLCLTGAGPKSPPNRERAGFVMAPDGLLDVAEDMLMLV